MIDGMGAETIKMQEKFGVEFWAQDWDETEISRRF